MPFFGKKKKETKSVFHTIKDDYKTYDEIHTALRGAGVETANLIVGIDATRSNLESGLKSFGGKSLHDVSNVEVLTPYAQSIVSVGRVLEKFDDDQQIPAFLFGDADSKDKTVTPFFPDERSCNGIDDVLETYMRNIKSTQLSGPTSFAPLINKSIEIAKKQGGYYILLIICDGQVSDLKVNQQAIIEASKYPISIVCVGVGDGPWEFMSSLDDDLPTRKFDNFQFIPFDDIVNHPKEKSHFPKIKDTNMRIALSALQEIPEQYAQIKKLGYLSGVKG